MIFKVKLWGRGDRGYYAHQHDKKSILGKIILINGNVVYFREEEGGRIVYFRREHMDRYIYNKYELC